MGKSRLLSIVIIILIIVSLITNVFLLRPFIILSNANPGDISESWQNETTLNVTVLQLQPRINWYDFQYNQSGTWISRLNNQSDVNNSAEYRFVVNVSSDQGWDDIEYINITAWYDNGSEATTYNQTAGGNINPEGVSMFEPIGGSAPKYQGQNIINPLASISSAQMMLETLGEEEAAAFIDRAIYTVLESGRIKSMAAGQMGMSTSEVGDFIADTIATL